MPRKKGQTPEVVTKKVESEKETFLSIYAKHNFNKTLCAKEMRIDRCTIHRWIREDKVFSDKMQSIKDSMIDKAQGVIDKKLDEENEKVAMWFLERRDPDYRDKKEVQVTQTPKIMQDLHTALLEEKTDEKKD